MAHISYFRLTPPVSEKPNNGPSSEEIRANSRTQVHVCSACGENPAAEQLKNCAGCRVTLYCSKKCQVSDWPVHKLSCARTGSTDINLKLAKKLMANDDLMFYLMVYSVLALELLITPETALHTCLVVKIATKDADPLAALRATINQEERGPGTSIMLQIAAIEKKPLASHTSSAMRVSLAKMKGALVGTEADSWPVVMLVFTSDDTNCLGMPCPIGPEAMKQGRERNPFVIESALMGRRELPVDETNIIEMFNNKIYMDKENRYLLHTKSKK
ncbi:hypothetical protein B0H12DRAFT_782219 [Mycena haematopus]|nr:hypothetical protein B0H12DRAFT_782219 [Mycena haematopus]